MRAPNTRVVANGGDLFRHYGDPRVVKSCRARSWNARSWHKRQRPANAPFRVLYVGYLRHEKGIDVLLDAFERLLVDIPNAELVMVGTRNSVDYGMSTLLDESLARLKSKSTVRLIEHLKFGPKLFQCFANADVWHCPVGPKGRRVC